MRVSVSAFNQFLYVPEKYICLIFANEYEPVLDTEERAHFIEFAMFCLTSAVVLLASFVHHFTTAINNHKSASAGDHAVLLFFSTPLILWKNCYKIMSISA
jgi:uncharacterized membrane protein